MPLLDDYKSIYKLFKKIKRRDYIYYFSNRLISSRFFPSIIKKVFKPKDVDIKILENYNSYVDYEKKR